MSIDTLVADFEFLDDWEDRYRYVIELGKALPPFPEDRRTDVYKVRGCASQVWIVPHRQNGPGSPIVFEGDSDALIVRGLIAILLQLYSGRTPREILDIDADAVFDRLGLREHLTSQRANGLSAMVKRMRDEAQAILSAGSSVS